MGRLIKIDNDREGHASDFVYEGAGSSRRCFLKCECGWQAEILQFRHPWSTIEVKVKVNEHMLAVGAKPYN